MLGLQLRSMSGWSESRGVFDDICYLRQAHLFQRFGLAGFDTDMSRDDDGYRAIEAEGDRLSRLERPTRKCPVTTPMPATGKIVIQYPPGPGHGAGAVPGRASGRADVLAFDDRGVRFRVPGDFSRAQAGFDRGRGTVRLSCDLPDDQSDQGELFDGADGGDLRAVRISHRTMLRRAASGSAICSAADARLRCSGSASISGWRIFSSAADAACSCSIDFLRSRQAQQFLRGALFALALVVGMLPTLISYWVNTGSPFTSTYHGAPTVVPLDFTLSVVWEYLNDHLADCAAGAVDRGRGCAVAGPRRRPQACRTADGRKSRDQSRLLPELWDRRRPTTPSRFRCSRCGPCCLRA